MDNISGIGLLLGIAAIIGGQMMEGGHVSALLQPTAFLIVIGGTMGGRLARVVPPQRLRLGVIALGLVVSVIYFIRL